VLEGATGREDTMSKLIFFDLETSGRNPKKAAIIQFGAVITGLGRPQLELNLKMRPHEDAEVNEEALMVSGVLPGDFDHPPYIDYREGKRQIESALDKCVNRYDKTDKLFTIGYNIHSFDIPFLRALFERCGDRYFGSWFWHPSIDLMLLSAFVLRNERHKMPNFKLGTVCRRFGIVVDEEQQHDALYDVKLCMELWRAIMEVQRA
jgi:DNA polymerase III subunit epsilon